MPNINFTFHFYRFLRYTLIFIFIENVICRSADNAISKINYLYSFMGVVIVAMAFLEFQGVQPFRSIIISLYFLQSEDVLAQYGTELMRLSGVMGNPNATGILIASTAAFPFLYLTLSKGINIRKIIFLLLFFLSIYVLFVMTGSRTAIFSVFFMVMITSFFVRSEFMKKVFTIFVCFFLIIIGFLLYSEFSSKIVIQDRIKRSFHIEEPDSGLTGIAKWSGRYYLWKNRIETMNEHGNPLAWMIGMGYTKWYKDYSDNGLLSSFMNNGFLGLLLKLMLYAIIIHSGIIRGISFFKNNQSDINNLSLVFIPAIFIIWDFTADMTEHYKIGQLFYVFGSALIVTNANLANSLKDNDFLKS